MHLSYDEFSTNLAAVNSRIRESCEKAGRPLTSVTLLPVTKTHPAEAAAYAARAGLKRVGENRVQEAEEKRALVSAPLAWELIGHLQSNKAKLATRIFERIQSVDSEKLIGALDKAAAAEMKTLAILLQVNAGLDPAKSGVDPDQAPALLEAALKAPHLRVEGLMTIAPLSDDPDVARRCFANLRTIRDQLAPKFGVALTELSMGMTGDLEAAILEGSTLIRVGTALFGRR